MSLRAAIMQPYLFPYVGYFQLVAAADRFVVLDDADYVARGWINRNRLLGAGGAYVFTLPVAGPRREVPIRQVVPDRARYAHFRARLLRGLAHDYAAAPHREAIVALVAGALPATLADGTSIADLATASLAATCARIGLPFAPRLASELAPRTHGLRGAARLQRLCRAVGADAYVNAPGGAALYDRDAFAAAGLALGFVRPGDRALAASAGPDGAPLSILHLLMHHDADAMRGLVADHRVA